MKINLLKYGKYILVFIVLCGLLSCKVTMPAYQSTASLPAGFTGAADSSKGIAAIPMRDFFQDSLLNDLIVVALKENLDLKKALQRIKMSRASLRMAKGAFIPTINAVATAGQRRFGDYTMDAIGNYDTNFSDNISEDQKLKEHLPDFYAGFQSSWEIDIWGKLRNGKRAAASRLLASEHGRTWITTSLVSEVANIYYELLALDNEMEIVNKNIVLQERAVEVIKVQKLAGRANELGVRQITAQLLNTRGLQADIRQEIIEAENYLNTLLGRYPQPIPRGKSIMDQKLPDALQAGIPAQMMLRRPDVRSAEYNFIASKADVNAARAAFFPALTLNASVGLQSFDASKLFNAGSLAYSILGGLTAPILNRNRIRADYEIAGAAGMEAFYEYQQVSIKAYQEVMNNLSRIDNLGQKAQFKAQEVEALVNAVSASNDLFATGFATYLEVIAAQRGVLEAELNLANTRKSQFQSVIGLYKSLGGGWE